MRSVKTALNVGCWMVLLAGAALAQPPDSIDRGRRPRGRDDFRPPTPPLMAALDVDRDGELSTEEIDGAAEALKRLDKNGDGRLSANELRPERGAPGFRPPGGRGPDRPDDGDQGPPAGDDEPPQARDREGRLGGPTGAFLARVMSFDEDDDGKLTRDELPDRMHRLLERADTNGDDALDRDELESLAERVQKRREK
jgi:hypothetical protein